MTMLMDFMTGAEAHRGYYIASQTSQPLVFDIFNCRGDESNLLECGRSFRYVCQHSQDASVTCSE